MTEIHVAPIDNVVLLSDPNKIVIVPNTGSTRTVYTLASRVDESGDTGLVRRQELNHDGVQASALVELFAGTTKEAREFFDELRSQLQAACGWYDSSEVDQQMQKKAAAAVPATSPTGSPKGSKVQSYPAITLGHVGLLVGGAIFGALFMGMLYNDEWPPNTMNQAEIGLTADADLDLEDKQLEELAMSFPGSHLMPGMATDESGFPSFIPPIGPGALGDGLEGMPEDPSESRNEGAPTNRHESVSINIADLPPVEDDVFVDQGDPEETADTTDVQGGGQEGTAAEQGASESADEAASSSESSADTEAGDSTAPMSFEDMVESALEEARDPEAMLARLTRVNDALSAGQELTTDMLAGLPDNLVEEFSRQGAVNDSIESETLVQLRHADIPRNKRGVPTVPDENMWIYYGGTVQLPLPGGGTIEHPDDIESFGLDP